MAAILSGSNVGLPDGHWMHKALAKEKTRLAKKKTAPDAAAKGGIAAPALASIISEQGASNG